MNPFYKFLDDKFSGLYPADLMTLSDPETSKVAVTVLFVCNRGDTIQYHSGLGSRELGQAPMLLVFLTDFPCNIYRLQKLQGKSVNITGFSLQILQKTPAESL